MGIHVHGNALVSFVALQVVDRSKADNFFFTFIFHETQFYVLDVYKLFCVLASLCRIYKNNFQGGGTVTVTSLQRSNSQISLVPGLAESSSTVPESVSHPFGSEDAKSLYKRLQQHQVL